MSWQENRRRKRTWYKHYRSLCDELLGLMRAAQRNGRGEGLAAEAVINMFFDLYERRQLHGRKRVAKSAYESIRLAVADSGLFRWDLMPREYTSASRPTTFGGLYTPADLEPKKKGMTNAEKEVFNNALKEVYEPKKIDPAAEIPF